METFLKNELGNVDFNLDKIKEKQVQNLACNDNFDSKILKCTDLNKIKIGLEFVENKEQETLFNYYRNITSSMPQSEIPGRNVKILVYDKISYKYLGLLQLTVDLLINENKTKYFHLNESNYNRFKKELRNSGANISLCVPLQPFGFNFCGGKLLSMLAFSKEVIDYYNSKFNIILKYLITLSINGKSIQYSRLKELKFIGFTAGYGVTHISEVLVENMKEYLTSQKVNIKSMSKHTIVVQTIKKLKLNESEILNHNKKKGIYIGMVGNISQDFLISKEKDYKSSLDSIEDIFESYKEKYGIKRQTHLLSTKRFK